MKPIIFILSFILLSTKASADYAGGGISIWPSGKFLNQNSIFVIDGYAASQDMVKKLAKKYPIYLKSGEKKVKLNVTEILIGEFYLTQVVLSANEKLEVGKVYEIYIDNLPDFEKLLTKWNPKTSMHEKINWTVTEGSDTVVPKWTQKPKEVNKTFALYGCGPEKFVNFAFKVEEQSEFLIKTTVSSKETKKQTSFYLKPSNALLKVGHGMCSGAFLYDQGNEYEVTFEIMDASGNFTSWIDEKIVFTKPNSENSSNE